MFDGQKGGALAPVARDMTARADGAEDIVFICGALRSGTTLLRLMINHHPALANPGEMDFLFEPPLRLGAPDMRAYARELSFNRVFAKLNLSVDPRLSYADLTRDFIRQLRTPGRILSINVHRNFDRIPAIFPQARYVHLLRDPRDVAKSSIGMGWAGNVFHGVDHWLESERAFDRLAAATPVERIHTLTHEDLLRAPERELARLCAFFGVAYDPAMLSYPSHTTYGPPDPGLIEQWRTTLTRAEVALIESKAGDMLAARGYARAVAAAPRPGPLRRLRLGVGNKIGRWRFLAKRNGALLTLADIMARRLAIPGLRDFTRRRMLARAAERLK